MAAAEVHTPAPHVCPWWLGYLLASPLRRLAENPERILAPWVRPGMTVLEPGCGMGYFSLPLARTVGPNGRVICVDLQQKMIDGLARRARKAGLLDRLALSVCGSDELGLGDWRGRVDLAVAIHVIHEVLGSGRAAPADVRGSTARWPSRVPRTQRTRHPRAVRGDDRRGRQHRPCSDGEGSWSEELASGTSKSTASPIV